MKTTRLQTIRKAWRLLGSTAASPAGWMSDEELEAIAARVPYSGKSIHAESLRVLQAQRTDQNRKDMTP